MDFLSKYGWNGFFADQLTETEKAQAICARITEPSRGLSRAVYHEGTLWAEGAIGRSGTGPAVGDWVIGSLRDHADGEKRLVIDRILKRQNKLSRMATGGKGYEQVLCANVDLVLITIAANQALNLPGLERYRVGLDKEALTAAIVITKADTIADTASLVEKLREVMQDIAIVVCSAQGSPGVEAVRKEIKAGKTAVLLGASGAGKSSLLNALAGTVQQRVDSVRESDQKGRHTTTGRVLTLLAGGGLIIDSPGIREFQPWQKPAIPRKSGSRPKPPAPSTKDYDDDEE